VTSGLVDLTKFAARVPLHVCIVDSVFVSVAILDVRCYDNYAVAQKPRSRDDSRLRTGRRPPLTSKSIISVIYDL